MSAGSARPRTSERGGISDPDSRARTHLANERTFLAWLRTGLSLIALGLVAARLLPVDLLPGLPLGHIFSALLVLSGTLMVIFGAVRYARAHREIDAADYDPAVWPILLVGALVSILGILAVPLVFLLR